MNTLTDLQDWILSSAGLKSQIATLTVQSAIKEFSNLESATNDHDLDWERLIFSASLLAKSNDTLHLETALRIAHAGIIIQPSQVVLDACLLLLNDLSNQRAIFLAEQKQLASPDFNRNLGFSAQFGYLRRKIDNLIFKSSGEPFFANKFQLQFWEATQKFDWIYASAPTAAGKTYIVFQYLLEQLQTKKHKLLIYLAPTRALVSEVERELVQYCRIIHDLAAVKVYSIPLARLYDAAAQTVFVFTQERLHLFLNAIGASPQVDILIVDEAHKIGEGMRGVILQEAIERVISVSPNTQVLFLSPPVKNPFELLLDKPIPAKSGVVEKNQPMVNQNLIYASQKPTSSKDWKIEIISGEEKILLGDVRLRDAPSSLKKRIAFVTAKLTENQRGILVYANGAADAEEIGLLLMQLVEQPPLTKMLDDLYKLAREGVHKDYRLNNLIKHGIAFHYGNMPTLLREKIEEAFNAGEIRYLICTSTLVEGVNLSCRTIFVRGPRKGNGNPMLPHDFWNLAGRAGRWGREFQGNIVCIDPEDRTAWKNGVPEKSEFEVERQTEKVLRKPASLIEYLGQRTFDIKTVSVTDSLEEVTAYLLSTYLRNGSLTKSVWSDRFSRDLILYLDNILKVFADKIDLPIAIVEKHSGVSAVSMQTLLNYFRERGPMSAKEATSSQIDKLQRWIPLTPDNSHAYENMADLIRRIHLKLYPAFVKGKEGYYAVLVLNWMRGFPLPRLIESNISYYQTKATKKKDIHAIIRDTMKDVEEVARFKAPKYIACYIDVLKFYLAEIGRQKLYIEEHPFDLYLEFGVMSQTFISLMLLGLSRMSAVEIGNKIVGSDLSEAACRQWLKSNDLDLFGFPSFVTSEVKEKVL